MHAMQMSQVQHYVKNIFLYIHDALNMFLVGEEVEKAINKYGEILQCFFSCLQSHGNTLNMFVLRFLHL